MTDLARVLVLAGGLTHERDVSLRSGRRVTDALKAVGVDALLHDADLTLLPTLAQERPDAVWIALHGGAGEDGAVRAVLDLAGVPYAGSTPSACRLAFDKPTAKELVLRAGVPTPPWLALAHNTFRELGAATVMETAVAGLGLPLMIKPAQGGSALGATVVRRAEDLPGAMVTCFSYDDTALMEHYVEGTELAVTVVDTGDGPRSLPAVEVCVVGGGPYNYEARYTAGETEFFTPARLPADVAARASEAALTAHRALGLADLSRTDLIVDAHGVPWFLEVNVSPGMTETSLLPLACAADGLDVGVLCRDLLAAAAARRS